MTISTDEFNDVILSSKQKSDNIVFHNLKKTTQNDIKRVLKCNSNNLIIEFNEKDVEELEKMYERIPEKNIKIQNLIYNQYIATLINYEIDKDKAKKDDSLNSLKTSNWQTYVKFFLDNKYPIYQTIKEKLHNKTIHFFIDNINSTLLQRHINDYYKNDKVTIREYTELNCKRTYRTSNKEIVEIIDNYKEYNEYKNNQKKMVN